MAGGHDAGGGTKGTAMIDEYMEAKREIAALRRQVDTLQAEVERYRAHQAQADIRTLEEARGTWPRFTRAGW